MRAVGFEGECRSRAYAESARLERRGRPDDRFEGLVEHGERQTEVSVRDRNGLRRRGLRSHCDPLAGGGEDLTAHSALDTDGSVVDVDPDHGSARGVMLDVETESGAADLRGGAVGAADLEGAAAEKVLDRIPRQACLLNELGA